MSLAVPGTILRDGVTLLYTTSITRKGASNDKEVFTNALGLMFSSGAATIELDVKNAVPATGVEFDALYYAMNHTDLSLEFKFAGQILTVAGRIQEETVETSAESPSGQNFTFKGRFVGRVAA